MDSAPPQPAVAAADRQDVPVKEKSIEVKVGALVLVCTALLVAFVFLLGDFGGAAGFRIPVDFPTASDIKPGAPVKIAGVTAGKVQNIEYWGGKLDPKVGRRVTVRVWLDVDPEKGKTLHDDAQFFISTQGILGEKYVEIDPGDYAKPILQAERAREGIPPLRMEILGQQLTKVAGAITRILEDNENVVHDVLTHADQTILSTKKTVEDADQLILDNRDAVKAIVARLDKTSEKVDKMVTVLEASIGDGKQIRRSLKNVENVTADLDENVGPALKDARAIARNLRSLSEQLRDKPTAEVLLGVKGADKVIAALDRAEGAIGKVDGVVDDVKAVTANARSGKGTVGGLLMDNELFMDLKLLLKDLKRHPWKFIWRE